MILFLISWFLFNIEKTNPDLGFLIWVKIHVLLETVKERNIESKNLFWLKSRQKEKYVGLFARFDVSQNGI